MTLQCSLNLENWDRSLIQYHDKEVCAFLRFGWPIGYSNPQPPTSADTNHPSAQNHMAHITKFIETELTHEVGPFKHPPFFSWTCNNHILSRPKKESQDRRIIIDLSLPLEEGVKQGIHIHSILGKDTYYSLPNIWDLTTCLQTLGPNSWVWKADLRQAYCQLRVDILDTPFHSMQVLRSTDLDLCPV